MTLEQLADECDCAYVALYAAQGVDLTLLAKYHQAERQYLALKASYDATVAAISIARSR